MRKDRAQTSPISIRIWVLHKGMLGIFYNNTKTWLFSMRQKCYFRNFYVMSSVKCFQLGPECTHLTLGYHQVKILSVYVTQNDEILWRALSCVSSISLAKTSLMNYREALTFGLRHPSSYPCSIEKFESRVTGIFSTYCRAFIQSKTQDYANHFSFLAA